jgi:hypothetical protein
MKLASLFLFISLSTAVSWGQETVVAPETTPVPTTPILAPTQSSPSFLPTRGSSFNPDIGINTLILYQNSNRGNDVTAEDRNGFNLQEAELQFAADVDPYWRFSSIFAIHQEYEAGPPIERPWVIEPEEAFAETLAVPSVTLKAGKFKTAFGKHNTLHTHAFPFIDAPIANQTLLGDEGLNDTGASLSALLPTPWFLEITAQAVSGKSEGLDYFDSASPNDVVGILHLKNLWDLSDDLTMELGTSGASGKNPDQRTTNLWGGDLTFKWRPDARKDRAIVWSTEGLSRDLNRLAFRERGSGVASWIQYQFNRRWWAQIRGEYLQVKQQDPTAINPISEYQRKQSALIGFIPSEFSGIRIQYDRLDDSAVKPEQKVMLQLNYSIGAHPAHVY